MSTIPKHILVVINEVDKITPILQEAVKMSQEFTALLEILFVHEDTLFSLPEYFSRDSHTINKDTIKKEISNTLTSLSYTENYALFVEEEDTVHRVQVLCEHHKDLFLLSSFTHGLSQKMIKVVPFPILFIKQNITAYTKILYIVDLHDNNKKQIKYIQTLFPQAKIELLFEHSYFVENYVFNTDFMGMTIDPGMDISINKEIIDQQKKRFDTLKKETGLDGYFVEEMDENLTEYINQKNAEMVVLSIDDDAFLDNETLSSHVLNSVHNNLCILR
jgi:hypothetical protein